MVLVRVEPVDERVPRLLQLRLAHARRQLVILRGSDRQLPRLVLEDRQPSARSQRGLQSPDPAAIELMRSYAATPGQILWKLRVPAALPYIFTALKISATSSVVGAIVGELPSGIQTGLGRALLTFSQYFSTGPERLFGAVLISALVGIVFFGLVSLAELWLVPARRRVE